MDSKDRDEAILEMFQDFHESPLNDEAVKKLRKGLQKFYPEVDWKDEHIDALKELHGKSKKEAMEWQIKHGPKDLGKFLSGIQVDVEED